VGEFELVALLFVAETSSIGAERTTGGGGTSEERGLACVLSKMPDSFSGAGCSCTVPDARKFGLSWNQRRASI